LNKNRPTPPFSARLASGISGRTHSGIWSKLLSGIASLLIGSLSIGQAAPGVTLNWDPNFEPDIAGYKLRYGTTSGTPSQTIDVGNTTTATVSDLNYSTTYYFTVTAYNTAGLESLPSNQVSHTTAPLGAYRLTVDKGSGSGNYTPGTQVTVKANAPDEGEKFERWMEDYQILLEPRDSTTTATIPFQDVKIAAIYSDLPRYALTVVNGTGSDSYASGTQVPVSANAAPAGKQFGGWVGQDAALLENPASATTTFTMPSRAATVTASYITVYALTVNGGTGSGTFPAGKVVQIAANPPPADQRFARWKGDAMTLASRSAANTTLTMPTRNATITAVFRRK